MDLRTATLDQIVSWLATFASALGEKFTEEDAEEFKKDGLASVFTDDQLDALLEGLKDIDPHSPTLNDDLDAWIHRQETIEYKMVAESMNDCVKVPTQSH